MEVNKYSEEQREKEAIQSGEAVTAESEAVPAKEAVVDKNKLISEEDKKPDKAEEEESSGGMSKGALGASGAVAAIAVIMAVVITSISATLTYFKAFGTYFDFAIETTVEYLIQDDKPVDYENFDTALRLVTVDSISDFSSIVELSTANPDLTYEMTEIKNDGKTGKLKIVFSGKVLGLNQNTKYKTQLIGDDGNGGVKVYEEKVFTTTGPKTEFNAVEAKCNCSVDGKFYFNLKFVDENGYYSNFKYQLISSDTKKVVKEGVIDDPTAKQSFDVTDVVGIKHVLVITFDSAKPSDIEKGKTQIEIKTNVKI